VVVTGLGDRGSYEQCVHERLRQVAARLALAHVEFLRVEAGRTARGSRSFEHPYRLLSPPEAQAGEGEPVAAQEEGSFWLPEREVAGPEPVDVVVGHEVVEDRIERHDRARIVGNGSRHDGEEGGVDAGVVVSALPSPAGVRGVAGGVGIDRVSERAPSG
jgi:hypothetical protein